MPDSSQANPSRRILTLKAHTGPCHVARYDLNGRYLLTGGQDRTVKLWSATSTSSSSSSAATPIKTYSAGHSHEILALDITPDNATFASGGGDKNVLIWDVATSSILRRFSAHQGKIYDVSFAGKDKTDILCTGGFDSHLRFYDLRAQGAWKPIMTCKEGKDSILTLAVRDHQVWTGCVDGVVRCYDMRKGTITEDTIDEPIVSLQASSSLLLVSTLASTHRIMDISSGDCLQTFTGHTNTEYRCHSTLTQAEDRVHAGDEQGKLRGWDVLTGKSIGEVDVSSNGKAVLWTECNPKKPAEIATATADGLVHMWSS